MSNARAARRRAERDPGFVASDQTIQLQNPVAQHFAAFIAGNATIWEAMALEELERVKPGEAAAVVARLTVDGKAPEAIPMAMALREAITTHCTEQFVVAKDSAVGQHLVLCGAGPSLAEHAAEWCPQGDQVWGCNSALVWLHDQGHKVTHGFTVDQTPHMLEEWLTTPPVEYLLATTVHPHLTELLRHRGHRVRFFHNYAGVEGPPVVQDGEAMEYEDWLYSILYPATIRAGSGLNSVNRALDLALFAGFERITVLGADCALKRLRPPPTGSIAGTAEHRDWLRTGLVMHADGGHAMASGASEMTLDGEIDGRVWTSKPDMLFSAVDCVDVARAHPGRITFIGDTLVNALMDKPDAFLLRMPTMVAGDGRVLRPNRTIRDT